MNNVRGIIFDCDGVLFESKQANLAYYNEILQHFNEPLVTETDREKAHLCHTAASQNVLLCLLGEERVPAALEMACSLDYRQFIPYMQPEPGMKNALKTLSGCYPLAVATNRGDSMASILEHFQLGGHFHVVVTSRDVENPKPAPDMLVEAANRMALDPDDLVFVGDSELDQAAAMAAGISFINYRGSLAAAMNVEHHDELVRLFSGGSLSSPVVSASGRL